MDERAKKLHGEVPGSPEETVRRLFDEDQASPEQLIQASKEGFANFVSYLLPQDEFFQVIKDPQFREAVQIFPGQMGKALLRPAENALRSMQRAKSHPKSFPENIQEKTLSTIRAMYVLSLILKELPQNITDVQLIDEFEQIGGNGNYRGISFTLENTEGLCLGGRKFDYLRLDVYEQKTDKTTQQIRFNFYDQEEELMSVRVDSHPGREDLEIDIDGPTLDTFGIKHHPSFHPLAHRKDVFTYIQANMVSRLLRELPEPSASQIPADLIWSYETKMLAAVGYTKEEQEQHFKERNSASEALRDYVQLQRRLDVMMQRYPELTSQLEDWAQARGTELGLREEEGITRDRLMISFLLNQPVAASVEDIGRVVGGRWEDVSAAVSKVQEVLGIEVGMHSGGKISSYRRRYLSDSSLEAQRYRERYDKSRQIIPFILYYARSKLHEQLGRDHPHPALGHESS